jgi:hypothetical protein
MPNGKIVAVHGSNISFSTSSGQVTLPGGSLDEVDFAVNHMGMDREFHSMNGMCFIIRKGDE